MNPIKDEVTIEIPIKQIVNKKLENVGVQSITVNATSEFKIGSKDNPNKFLINGYVSGSTFIINNANHEYDELLNDKALGATNLIEPNKNKIFLHVKNITVEDNNNIVISIDSNSNKTFVIEPTQFVVKEKNKVIKTYKTDNTQMELPFNFDSLITNEYINVKNLPYQFKKYFDYKSNPGEDISAQRKLYPFDFSGGEIEKCEIKDKNIEIYKLHNTKNDKSVCFIAHGTKLIQINIENAFAYENLKHENMIGFVIGEFGQSTSALGYKNLTEQEKDNIIDFLNKNIPIEKQVKQLLPEALQEQAILPKTVIKPKIFTKILKRINLVESSEEENNLIKTGVNKMETTEKVTDTTEKVTDATDPKDSANESVEENNATETSTKETDSVKDSAKSAEVEQTKENSKEQTEDNEQKNEKKTPVVNKTEEPKEEKKEEKEEKKEAKPEKAEKVETVDLTHIAKLLGVALFFFGFFTGFGGLLTMIIALGIGSNAWATDNLKKVGANFGKSKSANTGKFDLSKPAKISDEQQKVQQSIDLGLIDDKTGKMIMNSLEKINNFKKDGFVAEKRNEFEKEMKNVDAKLAIYADKINDADKKKTHPSSKAYDSYKDNYEHYLSIKKLLVEKSNDFDKTTTEITKSINSYMKDTIEYAQNKQNIARLTDVTEENIGEIRTKINESEIMAKTLTDKKTLEAKNAETDKFKKDLAEMEKNKITKDELDKKISAYDKEYSEEKVNNLVKLSKLSMIRLKDIYKEYNDGLEKIKQNQLNKNNKNDNNKSKELAQ